VRSEVGVVLAVALALVLRTPSEGVAQSVVSGTVRNGGSAMAAAAVFLVPLDLAVEPVQPPQERITIDQVHLTFVPNVLVVVPGTEVSFLNSDGVLHNVFAPRLSDTPEFDLGTYAREARRSWVFESPGVHIILCHIHPEMAAYVLVVPTHLHALTGADGTFEIEGVRPGRYRLHAWHARHWRDERSTEVVVTENGLSGLAITLGATAPLVRRP